MAFFSPVIGVQEVGEKQTVRVEMCYYVCVQTLDNDHEMRPVGALAVLFAVADTVGLSGGVIGLLDELCCCDSEPKVWFDSKSSSLTSWADSAGCVAETYTQARPFTSFLHSIYRSQANKLISSETRIKTCLGILKSALGFVQMVRASLVWKTA